MSSTRTRDKRENNIIIAINDVIQSQLDNGTMNVADANVLRDMLIRI